MFEIIFDWLDERGILWVAPVISGALIVGGLFLVFYGITNG